MLAFDVENNKVTEQTLKAISNAAIVNIESFIEDILSIVIFQSKIYNNIIKISGNIVDSKNSPFFIDLKKSQIILNDFTNIFITTFH